MSNCEGCPCTSEGIECRHRFDYCDWVAKGEIERYAHIINTSRLVSGKEVINENKNMNSRVVISTGNGRITSIPTSESIQVTNERNACPHYEKHSGCGCNRGRCKIGKGQPDINNTGLVSWWDCAACLRPGVELYEKNKFQKPV